MLGRFLGRGLLSSIFIMGGLQQLQGPQYPAKMLKDGLAKTPLKDADVDHELLVKLNGAGMVAAGGAMALGVLPRLSALVLAGLLGATNYVGHPFWEETDEQRKFTQRNEFVSNLAIIGGLLGVVFARRKQS